MSRLRLSLGPIAAAWLTCQTSILLVAPAVLWGVSAEELLECTCTHGEHAMCPMHHTPAPGSTICLMRGATDNGAAVLSSLVGAAGVLPATGFVSTPATIPVVIPAKLTTILIRPAPPETPPPRA